jgi:archaellum component FlaC
MADLQAREDIERIGKMLDGQLRQNETILEALELVKDKLEDLYARVERLDRLVGSPGAG